MLDGLRDIFLDALCYAPKHKRAVLISKWNKECQNVYELKEELKSLRRKMRFFVDDKKEE